MLSLIDKLVFEVFDYDFEKKNQSPQNSEFKFITKQLDLRKVQFKKEIIPPKYIKNIFYIDLIKLIKKNNLIIDLNANRKLLTKLYILIICSSFFINPIVAFQINDKIIIRKFFVFYDVNIDSDTYYIFLLKIIKKQIQNIFSIINFKFLIIKNEHIS